MYVVINMLVFALISCISCCLHQLIVYFLVNFLLNSCNWQRAAFWCLPALEGLLAAGGHNTRVEVLSSRHSIAQHWTMGRAYLSTLVTFCLLVLKESLTFLSSVSHRWGGHSLHQSASSIASACLPSSKHTVILELGHRHDSVWSRQAPECCALRVHLNNATPLELRIVCQDGKILL